MTCGTPRCDEGEGVGLAHEAQRAEAVEERAGREDRQEEEVHLRKHGERVSKTRKTLHTLRST